MKEIICTLDNMAAAAAEFLDAVGDNRLIAFHGHLGAGKTTFIKALCDLLGVVDNVCSPTFTIVNEYRAADGQSVFHFDFYRIDDLREAQDLGLEEYFFSGCFCFMEWPEKIADLLPEEVLDVEIEPIDQNTRRIRLCL
ncbi:MAG: tRNA (adenosine(37)-N6)-threonylcarbamoyltransferase complex ATPase subunit type 1 TsaE [Bacteroidales bacterium]|nr:tRNA (adenosine(37)-N6)-threonylcarbamoyltransferase complex ATPase subunit type 1 TsaE [Bacteroidales bacterium]